MSHQTSQRSHCRRRGKRHTLQGTNPASLVLVLGHCRQLILKTLDILTFCPGCRSHTTQRQPRRCCWWPPAWRSSSSGWHGCSRRSRSQDTRPLGRYYLPCLIAQTVTLYLYLSTLPLPRLFNLNILICSQQIKLIFWAQVIPRRGVFSLDCIGNFQTEPSGTKISPQESMRSQYKPAVQVATQHFLIDNFLSIVILVTFQAKSATLPATSAPPKKWKWGSTERVKSQDRLYQVGTAALWTFRVVHLLYMVRSAHTTYVDSSALIFIYLCCFPVQPFEKPVPSLIWSAPCRRQQHLLVKIIHIPSWSLYN